MQLSTIYTLALTATTLIVDSYASLPGTLPKCYDEFNYEFIGRQDQGIVPNVPDFRDCCYKCWYCYHSHGHNGSLARVAFRNFFALEMANFVFPREVAAD